MKTENNVQLLRILDLPVFANTFELGRLIHVNPKTLNALVMRNDKFYKRYEIKKKSGANRTIKQPNQNQKAVQAWILRNILDKLSYSSQATAFLKGRGTLKNVEPHISNRYFLCLDLEDFFGTIQFKEVYYLFNLLGYSSRVCWSLARLCTCDNSLPQGGITSPSLSNLVTSKLDRRLSGYVAKKNVTFTRYADDLTFSAQNPKILKCIYPAVFKIILAQGFKINHSKTRFCGPYISCNITGLVKNASRARFGIGRKKKREVRAMIYNFCSTKSTSAIEEQKIAGWLGYIKSVDEEAFKNLNRYFDVLKLRFRKLN